MKKSATYIMVTVVGLLIPALLAIGSFLGFPNDPQLGGCFWILIVIKGVVDLLFKDDDIPVTKDPDPVDYKPAYMIFLDSREEVDKFTDFCFGRIDECGRLLLKDINNYFGLTVYEEDSDIGWTFDQKPFIKVQPSKNANTGYMYTVEFPKWRNFCV